MRFTKLYSSSKFLSSDYRIKVAKKGLRPYDYLGIIENGSENASKKIKF
jgi:hypothetical protein